MAVLYGVATAGFLRRSRRLGDEFFGWLAIAAVLAAASHVNYLLYPAINSQSLYTGDVFRFAFYAVLLVGSHAGNLVLLACAVEGGGTRGAAADRLRSARWSGARTGLSGAQPRCAERRADEERLDRLRRAVERAQLESRRAISAMAAPSGQPFEVALAEAATEVAERYHVELDLDLTSDIRLSASRREAFVRIACEAVTNAARHSGANRVNLGLERDGSGVRLRVSDKGHGFDTADPGGGFGLTSMRERAHSVGARTGRLLRARPRQPGGGCHLSTRRRPLRVLIADDHAPSRDDVQTGAGT